MGTLGPERTFLVRSRDRPVALPSDLAGITEALWNDRRDLNWDAALSVPARQILQAMDRVREDSSSAVTIFDGRSQFDLGAWSVQRWEDAGGDAAVGSDVLGIERTNTSGRFVLELEAVIERPPGGERVTLHVAGQARAQGGDHTLVLVFKELDTPYGEHVWDARSRVVPGRWQAIDGEQDVVLHRDCRVRIEDRSVSSAPSRLEVRDLVVTVRRFGFDLDL